MKRLNLLPLDEINRRGRKKYRKYIALGIILLVITGFGLNYDVKRLQNVKDEVESKISATNILESTVTNRKNKVLQLNNTIFEIKYNNIPVNNLLYFIGKELPSDVQLFEVVSSNVVLKETLEGVSTGEDIAIEKDSKIEDNKEVSKDKEKNKEEEENDSEIVVTEKVKEEEEENKISQNGEHIVFRGSALVFDDIANFTMKLEDLDYFNEVEIIDVQSYYNGFQTYNIFEIHAKVAY
jgi:hypothetical protein